MNKKLIVMLVSVLLCGCGKSATDIKVEKIEIQITALQSNITELYVRNENRRIEESNMWNYQSNTLGLVEKSLGVVKQHEDRLFVAEVQLSVLQFLVTNTVAKQPVRAQQYIARPAQPSQMPADVLAGIRSDAEQKWPGNYDMQLYVIEQQTEAWHKLHP